ncbi:hypothetical protein Tco_0303041 [Tanacetum coccineum]
MESQLETTQTVSALKLHILKTGDYDLWSMRMEQYLTHTDYALWEVIVNGDAPAVASASAEGPIPPKTAEQKLARKNELKAKSTLLLAIPDEHLLKFHGIKDAKTLWEAIKTRFGGNKESKKMQKTILKQQYENFVASRSEGLDKTYDRFQKLISQLEIHGEVISQEDANLKLLRSLPSAWNTHTLIMRNKSDLDKLRMDDLRTIDTDDLEEMDLKWQVVMLTMRVNEILKEDKKNLNFNGQRNCGLIRKFEFVKKHNKPILEWPIHPKAHQVNQVQTLSRESDVDESLVNYRFKIGEGFHAVPPPYTGNYMPSRLDLSFTGLDDSVYKTKVSETETSISKTSKDFVEKPKIVRPSSPIIEDWDTDSDDDSVFRPKSNQTKPKFTKINFVKSDENVKFVNKENTHRQVEYPRKSQSPRDNRRNWNGMMTHKLGKLF